MKLYMARHGETDWNLQQRIQGRTDTRLNETGRRQAQNLGQRLQEEGYHITKLYTSPQKRAFETAQIVSRMLQVPCERQEGLQEISFGAWEGHTWDEVMALYPQEYADWHKHRRTVRTPEGESYQELLERVVAALCQIIQKESGKDSQILVVAHSAVLMSLQWWHQDVSFHEMVHRFRTRNSDFVNLNCEQILSKSTAF